MDGPTLLKFMDDYAVVRGFRPRRVYVSYMEWAEIKKTKEFQNSLFHYKSSTANGLFRIDGAEIYFARASIIDQIRAWDLLRFP